jgi:hypothetical protein
VRIHVAHVANRVVDVAIHSYQIEPAIEIAVQESAPETQRSFRRKTDPALHRDVGKVTASFRPIQADHLIVEVSDGDACAAGVVEIADVNAHSGTSLAFLAEGNSRIHPDIAKSSVALIAIELVWLGVVGNEQSGQPS